MYSNGNRIAFGAGALCTLLYLLPHTGHSSAGKRGGQRVDKKESLAHGIRMVKLQISERP